jgi:hypothetical protein
MNDNRALAGQQRQKRPMRALLWPSHCFLFLLFAINTQPFCKVIDTGVRCYGKEDGVPAFQAGPLVQDAAGNLWIGGDTSDGDQGR